MTTSAQLDFDAPLYRSGRALVITTLDAPEVPVPAIRAGHGRVDLTAALTLLHREGAREVLCEGGPSLNGQLLALDLVDEFFLTLAPRTAVGASTRVAHGPAGAAAVADWRLAHVLEHDGELFLRYLRQRAADTEG